MAVTPGAPLPSTPLPSLPRSTLLSLTPYRRVPPSPNRRPFPPDPFQSHTPHLLPTIVTPLREKGRMFVPWLKVKGVSEEVNPEKGNPIIPATQPQRRHPLH